MVKTHSRTKTKPSLKEYGYQDVRVVEGINGRVVLDKEEIMVNKDGKIKEWIYDYTPRTKTPNTPKQKSKNNPNQRKSKKHLKKMIGIIGGKRRMMKRKTKKLKLW